MSLASPDECGRMLYQAAQYNNVDLLADLLTGDFVQQVDWRDEAGRTPLLAAATAGHLPCVDVLLSAGADVNAASNALANYKTALHLAAETGHTTVLKRLIEAGADVYALDRSGHSALQLAQMADRVDATILLIDAVGKQDERISALREEIETATAKADVGGVKAALKKCADGRLLDNVLNIVREDAYTPLYRCCERGHDAIVQLLLQHGAEPRLHSVTFYSPLYIAVYAGHSKVVQILLQQFPELANAPTFEGWLPIHAACKTGDIGLVRQLLHYAYPPHTLHDFTHPDGKLTYRFAFDVNQQDADCRTALYLAAAGGHADVVKVLLNFRIDTCQSSMGEDTDGTVMEDVLVKDKRNASVSQPPGESPMRRARTRLNVHKVNVMTDTVRPDDNALSTAFVRPVAVDVYSRWGRTPLQIAVQHAHRRVVQLLVEMGRADVNLPLAITDEDLASMSQADAIECAGSGALVEACRQRDSTTVDLLLQHGAVDHDNQALHAAIAANDDALACRLLCRQVFADPEYRVQKAAVESASAAALSAGTARPVLPSSLCPSVACMLNWHRAGVSTLARQWLAAAAIHLNPKIRATAINQPNIAFAAITRIDLSRNQLTCLPFTLLQLPSLRILNVARNKIATLGAPDDGAPPSERVWRAAALEEMHMQHNEWTTLPSSLLTDLPNLQSLDMSHNNISTLPTHIWLAPKLKDLNVSYNRLRSLPSWMHGGTDADTLSVDSFRSDGSNETDASVAAPSTAPADAKPTTVDDDDSSATVAVQELKRHNLWQKSVELCKVAEDTSTTSIDAGLPVASPWRRGKSRLTSLNLAHNAFTQVPECLSCCAPSLTRLNLSANQLKTMGPLSSYPSRLKHLDLGHNIIETWWSMTNKDGSSGCHLLPSTAAAMSPSGTSTRSRSPTSTASSRRRSQSSAARTRTASVVRGENAASTTPPACSHRQHTRLDHLRTLICAHNRLSRLILSEVGTTRQTRRTRLQSDHMEERPRLVFPCLSMLDVSDNRLTSLPPSIADLTSLSVLNVADNKQLHALPPEMGLLHRLWNLTVAGCNLDEPLRSMIESSKFKTMHIVGYLKSVLEDSRPYTRMKLMVVGIHGIGKSSLLEQLKSLGSTSNRKANNEMVRSASVTRSIRSFGEQLAAYCQQENADQVQNWSKRMGHSSASGNKTARGVSISTVGVDVADWTYEPKKAKGITTHGPITFRTWDFGGQREYYATHQYFLSRRSLYLVVWKITDGEAGVDELQQWLVNIQARAPNSPCIIVATHYDEVLTNQQKFPQDFVNDLQQMIRERFVLVPDSDKKGMPRVVDSVVVSCKNKYNMQHLAQLIYSTAFDQRSPASKERLLEQKIPASYIALEEIVGSIADERKAQNKEPVMTCDMLRAHVQTQMKAKLGRPFRDNTEFNQAVAFLHDNGVLLHYEDAALKDLYFVDPQWLCDVLAHVITIREINPFAKTGVMKVDDLKLLFKSAAAATVRQYILSLLQKFEVGLTWDGQNLLIPSLLPDEYQLRAGYPDAEVLLAMKTRGWTIRELETTTRRHSATGGRRQSEPDAAVTSRLVHQSSLNELVETSPSSPSPPRAKPPIRSDPAPPSPTKFAPVLRKARAIFDPTKRRQQMHATANDRSKGKGNRDDVPTFDGTILETVPPAPTVTASDYGQHWRVHEDSCVRRLLLLSYVPSGFWSRLLTRLLADELVPAVIDQYLGSINAEAASHDGGLKRILAQNKPTWLLWQTGLEIRAFDQQIFSLKQFLPLAHVRDVDYDRIKWLVKQEDGAWRTARAHKAQIIEIFVPDVTLSFKYASDEGDAIVQLHSDVRARTRLLSLVVDAIDTLLEDWYPSLGTRFVHTSEGRYLVTRLVPCTQCVHSATKAQPTDATVSLNNDSARADDDEWTIVGLDSRRPHTAPPSRPVTGATLESAAEATEATAASVDDCDGVYSFTIEECILCASEGRDPQCPQHDVVHLDDVAPDTKFLELDKDKLIRPETVKRGKMIGRGAFGFVFKAAVRAGRQVSEVALKMLQPVDPGFGARPSAAHAFHAAQSKWQREPQQYACRAYITARQELAVLAVIHHANIVPLIGVCPRPLALVIALAPLGALNALLSNYRRSGAKVPLAAVQQCLVQCARALEYLHQQKIIYRDLKSENLLVWRFPPPFSAFTDVDIKLGDYGISRSVYPSGGAKGFGGTEGFMAPEISRYNGEEEYNEKADIFSFGMFMYELLTLKQPFEGQEQVKEYLLDGGRPELAPCELLQPTNVLDLMVVCWAHAPHDRPTSSQLVSITTAPEFTQIVDVVSMERQESSVLAADAFGVEALADDAVGNALSPTSPESDWSVGEASQLDAELWLACADGRLSVLSCNEHGWLEHKDIYVDDESFVTALCLVDDAVWLAELTGVVRVFCARTFAERATFPLAPAVQAAIKTHTGTASPPPLPSLPVADMRWLQSRRRVLVLTQRPACLLVCRQSHDGRVSPIVASVALDSPVFSMCLVDDAMLLTAWVGGQDGAVHTCTVHADDRLHVAETVNHYDPPIEGVDVRRMLSSRNDARYAWSYVFPGSTLYQWNTQQRGIVAKLDCAKIVPCSESLDTLDFEERLAESARCQVTAWCLVDRCCQPALLYVGTTTGVVVVAEADQLRPLVACRPHQDDVRILLPVHAHHAAASAATTSCLSTPVQQHGTAVHGSKDSRDNASSVDGRHSQMSVDSLGGAPGGYDAASHSASSYVISVGKGYRCLMQRFVDNYREDSSVMDSRNRDVFAIMWRADTEGAR